MRLTVAKVLDVRSGAGSSLKSANWGSVVVLSGESSSLRWALGVDGESELVDSDVMMEPADQRKVGWIVVTAS
jgi:hypothetical protein